MSNERDAIRVVDPGQVSDGPPAGFFRREIDLPVRQEVLHVAFDVPDRPLRLAEAAPLVWAIDDRVMAVHLRHAREQDREVFCRKGCWACCERFLIVLSPAEMYAIHELIDTFEPERKQRVETWFDEKFEQARRTGLVDHLRSLPAGTDPLDVIEQWWRDQPDTECVFLDREEGSCSIYPYRFIACREYCSMLPPSYCARRATARLAIPLNLINVLWQLEQRLTGEPTGAVSLPFLAMWVGLRAEQALRTWPAREMINALLAILADTAAAAQHLTTGTVVARDSEGQP